MTGSRPPKGVSAAVTWGLFAAWAANDIEELATMARWPRRARPRLEARFPGVPASVWNRMDVSQRHVNVSIALMGGIIAAASAEGARTGGRSPVFRTVLTGFGLHGLVHMAQSAGYRGYTPGVATSPTVVVPYTLWALHRLRVAGIPAGGRREAALGLALLPVATAAVHGLARVICDGRHASKG
ncbi:HXXEE domain-containing protein [Streptomyces sannanensis]|uniref:HXXEE domain-containing protein n=1 Tax=Streptomyces sannanensis TaxID=285536 RepID=UPI0031E60640